MVSKGIIRGSNSLKPLHLLFIFIIFIFNPIIIIEIFTTII